MRIKWHWLIWARDTLAVLLSLGAAVGVYFAARNDPLLGADGPEGDIGAMLVGIVAMFGVLAAYLILTGEINKGGKGNGTGK